MSITNSTIRFYGFRLELETPGLFDRLGRVVPLRRKSLMVLRLLAEQHDSIVTRETLLREIWPGVEVTSDSIVQCIGDIRRATGDFDHRIIQVIPRRGYRLNTHSGFFALPLCEVCRTLVLDYEQAANPDVNTSINSGGP